MLTYAFLSGNWAIVRPTAQRSEINKSATVLKKTLVGNNKHWLLLGESHGLVVKVDGS
jgi:hypothetical protein